MKTKEKEIQVKSIRKGSQSLRKLTATFGINTITSAEQDLDDMERILAKHHKTTYIVYEALKKISRAAYASGLVPANIKSITVTQSEVAKLINCSRQAVAKAIGELEVAGIIEIKGKTIFFK